MKPAHQSKYFDTADTYTISMTRLCRVIVTGGVAAATVTVRHATSNEEIAVIEADDRDIGTVFDLEFGTRKSIEVVLSGATKVTVTYD